MKAAGTKVNDVGRSGIGCSVKRAREMKIFLLRPTPYSNHVEDAARGPGPARDPILSGPRDVPKL